MAVRRQTESDLESSRHISPDAGYVSRWSFIRSGHVEVASAGSPQRPLMTSDVSARWRELGI